MVKAQTTKSPKPSKKTKSTTPKLSNTPVVTLMGHVDHGKTTLLDAIRNSNLVSKEHGGITQHVGAYQISHKGRTITFIDTPGHAAFAKMRAQGAQVTDVVVLVVAANDGVKPQTIEALSHIKAAKVPFLVAFNKIDLPEANVERVKGQLAEAEVVVESYGGKIVSVEVSATTKKNIDQLLDMIVLLSDLNQQTKDKQASLDAVVIESRQDKGRGMLATVLMRNGTLRVGDEVYLGDTKIKIRALNDELGRSLTSATPGMPAEVLGFKTLPVVGQRLRDTKDELHQEKDSTMKEEPVEPSPQVVSEQQKQEEEKDEEKDDKEEERQSIRIVLKADVAGTLEAIVSNLSDDVEIISRGVGEVTEADVLLAEATKATVYSFNTKTSSSAMRLAEIEKVTIRHFEIIYKLFEDLEKQVLKMLEPTIDEEETGEAHVIEGFEIRDEKIAGCKVIKGEMNKSATIHLKRNGEIIANSTIKSLRKGKEEVDKVKSGTECGMTFKPRVDFRAKDVILSYRIVKET